MSSHQTVDFLAGVIEGFYGQPWTQAERFELFDWMAKWGLNSYLYAPKDDLKQRALWRELYSPSEADQLGELIRACQNRKLRFIYALSPGLDIRYSKERELEQLKKRLEQMLELGCQHFALLFDDIPDQMDSEDLQRFGSLAAAQGHVTNAMFQWTRDRSTGTRLLFCPTPYCGRMAERKLGGERYLETIGRELLPEIEIFWTGPEVISREITVSHVQELQSVLRRNPLIWDNLHANDYDGRRFYCGPYAGRPPELRNAVSGILINPNSEFLLNYVPIQSLAAFLHTNGTWDPRKSYLSAMREWLSRFATINKPVTLEDLVLFGDCYYLPHQEGVEVETFYENIRSLLAANPSEWFGQTEIFRQLATRLRDFCTRIADLQERPLYYALSRRAWELREELDLLLGYVEFKLQNPNEPYRSDFHLLGTYRFGIVRRLQGLLAQKADGTFTPEADSHDAAGKPIAAAQ